MNVTEFFPNFVYPVLDKTMDYIIIHFACSEELRVETQCII